MESSSLGKSEVLPFCFIFLISSLDLSMPVSDKEVTQNNIYILVSEIKDVCEREWEKAFFMYKSHC